MMSSANEALIAYERERLERAGYSVVVTPLVAKLPTSGEMGNDVIVGTLTATAQDEQMLQSVALQSEGFTISGELLVRGTLVVLRRRWYIDTSGKAINLKLTDAVRLHPYIVQSKENKNGKQ